MKRFISFLFLTSALVNVTIAQNVTIPDSNFKNALLANSAINLNADSEIQLSEAQAYTGEINVNSVGISDMTGIEAFINISSLRCSYNQLTMLDVSSNTALTLLECIYNHNLSTLTLGSKPLLKILFCYEANLSELNVGEINSLEHLNCGNNPLTVMDLSDNPNLKGLDIRNSDLISLDMRNGNNTAISNFYMLDNPNLTCVNVDDPSYSSANWSNIDEGVIFSTDCSVSFDVTFVVTDGTIPVENAHIKFGETYYITNSNGEVIISGVGYGHFNYSIIAESFQSIMNTIDISDNVTVNITLTPGTSDIVYIPDYQLRSALLQNASINVNDDSEIQLTEAHAYTDEIDVQELGISDMTGIEAFINISILNCNNNQLTRLDVSNNTALTGLFCIWNVNLSSLILGSKPLLTTLFCYGNKLTELNIDDYDLLESLHCGNTLLTTMNLSNNPNLERVDIRECNLVSLDMRNGNNSDITTFYIVGNPDLTCVNVDDPAYSSANWTDIDTNVVFSLNCEASDDAALSSIEIDGTGLSGFQPDIFHYNVELSAGTNIPPVVSAEANNENATISITQAGSVSDTATIEVTSENELKIMTYTISFSVAAVSLDNNPLSGVCLFPNPVENNLYIEGVEVPGEILIYNISGEMISCFKNGLKVIDVSMLQSGIYFVGISVNQSSRYFKFIKK